MFDVDPSPTGPQGPVDPSMLPEAVPHDSRVDPQEEPTPTETPVSTSWPAVTAPWGTPGNHLTGPIPRIRRRDDGTLTHDGSREES